MPLVEFWINFNPADVLYNFLVKPKELRKLKDEDDTVRNLWNQN
jgi:hypothetical protein